MKLKAASLILFYFSIATLASIYQSCDILRYDGWICDLKIFGGSSNLEELDDLTQDIEFFIYNGVSCNTALYYPPDFGFFTNAHAFQKCVRWKNDFDANSYHLSLNRKLIIDNQVINENSNLLGIASIRNLLDIRKYPDCKIMVIEIKFPEQLRNRLTFEEGEYIVTFSCKTTDNKELENSRRVIFKN